MIFSGHRTSSCPLITALQENHNDLIQKNSAHSFCPAIAAEELCLRPGAVFCRIILFIFQRYQENSILSASSASDFDEKVPESISWQRHQA